MGRMSLELCNIMYQLVLAVSLFGLCNGGTPTCSVTWEEKCWDEPREHCTTVLKPYTVNYIEQECETVKVPKIETVPETKCTEVPEEICDVKYENKCHTEYKQECKTTYKDDCETFYNEECTYEDEQRCDETTESKTHYVKRNKCGLEHEEKCYKVPKNECMDVEKPVTKYKQGRNAQKSMMRCAPLRKRR